MEKEQMEGFLKLIEFYSFNEHIPSLFAFSYKAAYYKQFQPFLVDIEKEYDRLFFYNEKVKSKFVLSSCNENYKLCSTYPQKFVIPSASSDKIIEKVTKFRSRGRIPIACYLYAKNETPMFRCSQPLDSIKISPLISTNSG